MHLKNPGISLLLSLGVSLLMLLMAFGLLNSVERSFERDTTIERSLQFYYALEGGLENALFHKNARGKGTHMPEEATQPLEYSPSLGIEAHWSILSQENPTLGLLREGDSLEIPLSVPQSITPETEDFSKKTQGLAPNDDSFILQIYKSTDDMPADIKEAFEAQFGKIDFKSFIFPESQNPLLGWHISRTDKTTGKKELFRPPNSGEGSLCGNTLDSDQISFRLCPEDLSPSSEGTSWSTLDSLSGGEGHLEGLEDSSADKITLKYFLDFGGNFDFKIHLFTLGSFEALTPSRKIPGIPFSLTLKSGETLSSKGFNSESFTIHTALRQGVDFAQEVEIKLQEKTPNTLFNYVILE